MSAPRAGRRATDHRLINLRENWYRDLWLLAISAVVGLVLWNVNGQVNRLQSVGEAVCSLRSDLQTRVGSAESFLKTHPEGFAGIPASTIRVSLKGQKATLRALAPLRCP